MDSLSVKKNPVNNPRMDLLHNTGDNQQLDAPEEKAKDKTLSRESLDGEKPKAQPAPAPTEDKKPEPKAQVPDPAPPQAPQPTMSRTMPSLVKPKPQAMDIAAKPSMPENKAPEANKYVVEAEASKPHTPVPTPMPEPRHVADIQTAVSPPKKSNRKIILIVALIAVLLLLGTAGAWWYTTRDSEEEATTPPPAPTTQETQKEPEAAAALPATPVPASVDSNKIADGTVAVTNQKPVISGTADPNSSVEVTIKPEGTKLTATADASGAWTATAAQDIPTGSHQVEVVATAGKGSSKPASFALTINAAQVAQQTPVAPAETKPAEPKPAAPAATPAPAPAAATPAPAPAPAQAAELAPTGDATKMPTLLALIVMIVSSAGWYYTRRRYAEQ